MLYFEDLNVKPDKEIEKKTFLRWLAVMLSNKAGRRIHPGLITRRPAQWAGEFRKSL